MAKAKKPSYLWACVLRRTKKVVSTHQTRQEARERAWGAFESVKRVQKHGKGYRIIGRG